MIKNDVKDFDEMLDVKYGKRGTQAREKWENEFWVSTIEFLKVKRLYEQLIS
jgi:hypothetical protein